MKSEIHKRINNIENELVEISNILKTDSYDESVTLNNTEHGVCIEVRHPDGTKTTYSKITTE